MIFSGAIPALRAPRISPPETVSAPAPAAFSNLRMAMLEHDLTAKQIVASVATKEVRKALKFSRSFAPVMALIARETPISQVSGRRS